MTSVKARSTPSLILSGTEVGTLLNRVRGVLRFTLLSPLARLSPSSTLPTEKALPGGPSNLPVRGPVLQQPSAQGTRAGSIKKGTRYATR